MEKYNKTKNSINCKKFYYKNKNKILPKQKDYKKVRRRVDEITRIKELIRAYTKNKFKREICGKCGETRNLQFHHFVYRLPLDKNDFTVLCKKCHGELHGYL